MRRVSAASSAVALLGVLGVTAILRAQEPWSAKPSGTARSIGSPTDGALVGGVPLRERADLRLRWPDGPRWALPELVGMIERGADRVGRLFPGSVLLIGDLSRREGGSIDGHLSHASGRDADVGFYYSDARGRFIRADRLLAVGEAGTVGATRTVRFDEARNWALIGSFLNDPGATVQRVFVAAPLRRLLLDYGKSHGAEPSVLERAAATMRQPSRGSPHDDHFHVRIACPREQLGACVPDPIVSVSRLRTAALETFSR